MNEEIKQVLLRVTPFLLVIIGISIAIKRKKLTKANLYIQRPISYSRFLQWWLLFLVFILITEFTLYQLGILKVGSWNNSLVPSIIKIVGIVVLAPIAEELIFRALVLFGLRKLKINVHVAIVIQALLFVALHSFTFQNTISSNIGIAQVFIDAVIYAYAMYATKSLYTPIIMHSTGNLIAVIERLIF